MKNRFSNWVWGTFLLLAAAFIVFHQVGDGFVDIGVGSIIVAALAVAFFVQCLAQGNLFLLPVPLAVLYVIFHEPLGWPYMQAWTLILAAVLASIGLGVLTPRKFKPYVHIGARFDDGDGWVDSGIEGSAGDDNNPVITVSFTAVSKYVRADALETLHLKTSFGTLEIFLDQAKLSPNGARVICSCSFGAIVLVVPRHWQVDDKVNCALGGVDNNRRYASPAEDAPRLTIVGDVSLGGLEIKYV